MSYFTTRLSVNLQVKDLKFMNIWRSYRQNGWLFHAPHLPCTFVLKDADFAIYWITGVLRTETVTNRCYVNRQIDMSYYQQISNYCKPVLFCWPTDWRHQRIRGFFINDMRYINPRFTYLLYLLTDRLVIMYCILLRQLFCVVAVMYSGSWDFYMADVNRF